MSAAASRKATPFVEERRRWREALSAVRKDAAREHQHQQQELLKLREEQAAKLRTKDKEQDTLQASKEALQAKLRAKQFVYVHNAIPCLHF